MPSLPSLPYKFKGWFAVGFALLLGFAIFTLAGEGGLMELKRLRAEQDQLEIAVLEQQEHNDALRAKIEALKSDDHAIEREARRRLTLVKPNEIIYRDPPTAPKPAP